MAINGDPVTSASATGNDYVAGLLFENVARAQPAHGFGERVMNQNANATGSHSQHSDDAVRI